MRKSTSFLQLFVGFILTATGGHVSCPIELSPPRVVLRYGSSVQVNCSTSEILIEGMGWEATQGGTGLLMVNHLTWTVDKLTDWTVSPLCFLNHLLSGKSKQCMKKAEVVLYTFPENITVSSSGDSGGVLEEKEEYNLTCHVHHVAPVEKLTVWWYKEDRIIFRDTFNNSSKKPVDQSSIYSFTPTRKDNGVTFRCVALMDLGPEGPQLNVSSQEYNITVHYGPDVCAVISLLEGETLESQCPVEGNPNPVVSWKKDGQPTDPSVPLSRNNAGLYTIEAEGFKSIKETRQVLVSYGPELWCPSSYTAQEYAPHNLTCTVEGYPKPQTTWYKDGEEVELPEKLTRSDAGQYLITASNNLSSVRAIVEVTVTYPPSQIVELEDSEIEVGSAVWLKCSSMGNPRPKYVWKYYRAANVVEENEDGVSRLLIRNATTYNRGLYTCHAINDVGNVSKTARVTVKGASQECPVEISPGRMVIRHRGPSQNATCKVTSASARNVKEIYWQLDNLKIHMESWPVNTDEDWDVRPVCAATFMGIGTCHKPFDFTLYKTPDSVFIRPVQNVSSVVEGAELQLQCDIADVAPARSVAVQWYLGNDTLKLVNGSVQVTGCPQENSTNCDIGAIGTPVSVSSTISIAVKREHNAAEFRCEALMDLGPSGPQPPPSMMSGPLNITVFYKPRINVTKLPKTIPVFGGYTEELICEADGHPPPKIQWLYSLDKVSRVSDGRLTVSTAGIYNCTATNEVDSVFYAVEVVLMEDYLPLIAGFVAVTVVAISIIFIFIYSIYYKNTKMRRYSLKNPKLSTHNGNVAHNGWDLQFPMTKLS